MQLLERGSETFEICVIGGGSDVDVAGEDIDACEHGGVAPDYYALDFVAGERLEDPLWIEWAVFRRHGR